MAVPETPKSGPRSSPVLTPKGGHGKLPVLPADNLDFHWNEFLHLVTLELQAHIEYNWEKQQTQWHQLRTELREQHQELLQLLPVQMHRDVKPSLVEQFEEPRVAANLAERCPAKLASKGTTMFDWTTARLLKAQRRASTTQVSNRARIRKWFNRMFVVPPSFKKKRASKTGLEGFVTSNVFLALSGLLIFSNSVYLGWYADFSVKNELRRVDWGSSYDHPWIGRFIFSALLVLEVSIRVVGLGWRRYLRADVFWNVLDLVLAILALLSFFQAKDKVPLFQFWRIIRLFRLIHTAPLFRLPVFSHLRMITNALLRSIPSFLWAVTFGSLFIYFGGVGFCLALARELQNEQVQLDNVNPARKYFSNLTDAMKHLYMVLTNGTDWIEVYNAIKSCDPLMRIGLLCFNVFMVFAVINIISAMFIERAFNVIRDDRDFWVVEETRRQRDHRKRIFGLFDEMDKDGSGDVTWKEFEQALGNPHVEAYLSFVDLDVSNLYDIFQLLDKDRNGSLDIHEFLDGLEVLKGPAKRVEVLRMYELISELVSSELRNLPSFISAIGASGRSSEDDSLEGRMYDGSPVPKVLFGKNKSRSLPEAAATPRIG